METTTLQQEITSTLPHFTGSEMMYAHRTFSGRLLLTEGCNYIREKCESFWLFDLIQSYQYKLKSHHFQTWTLERVDNHYAFMVTCTDGNDKVLVRQKIPFSDFPLPGLVIWKVDNVVMLPSEY